VPAGNNERQEIFQIGCPPLASCAPDAASEDASVAAAAAAPADTKTLRPLSSLQTNVGDFN